MVLLWFSRLTFPSITFHTKYRDGILKGTVNIISSEPPRKDTTVPLNPKSDINMEANIVFPYRKVIILGKLILTSKKCASHYCRETADETRYFIHTNQTKVLRVLRFVNQALPSLHEGLLEITLTIPLNLFVES